MVSFNYIPQRRYEQTELSPLSGDLIAKALQTYDQMIKGKYLEPNAKEDLLKKQLFNQYYGPNIESEISERGARTGLLGEQTKGVHINNQYLPQQLIDAQKKRQFEMDNPFFNQTGTSGDLGRMLYLQKLLKSNPELLGQINQSNSNDQSDSYIPSIMNNNQNQIPTSPQNSNGFDADKMLQSAIMKITQGKQAQFAPTNTIKELQALSMAEQGVNPGTGQPFISEDEKKTYVDALRKKTSGLGKGTHFVYDPETHEKIGEERPTTNEEKKMEAGRGFFNEVIPVIRKADEFSGKDSIRKFDQYASEYGKNPVATQKIDDLLLADRLLSAGVVNEAATLGAGKQLAVFESLKNALTSMDIPQKIKSLELGFKIPHEANIKAGIRAQQVINEATQKAASSVPATRVNYYHPEKYLKSKEEKIPEKEKKAHYSDTDIKLTAKKYGITEDEVKKRLKAMKGAK